MPSAQVTSIYLFPKFYFCFCAHPVPSSTISFALQFFDQDSLNHCLDLVFKSFDNDDSGARVAPFLFHAVAKFPCLSVA